MRGKNEFLLFLVNDVVLIVKLFSSCKSDVQMYS